MKTSKELKQEQKKAAAVDRFLKMVGADDVKTELVAMLTGYFANQGEYLTGKEISNSAYSIIQTIEFMNDLIYIERKASS